MTTLLVVAYACALAGCPPVAGTPCGTLTCGPHATCLSSWENVCVCAEGYEGDVEVGCTDIDECAAHPCGPLQICKNVPGSYLCNDVSCVEQVAAARADAFEQGRAQACNDAAANAAEAAKEQACADQCGSGGFCFACCMGDQSACH
jgi:hypothetical protein